MVNQKIQIAKIDTSRRLRPVDPAHAEVIAASVAEVGLKQPITVRPHPHRDEEGCAYEYELVIGLHRLVGVDLFLGWNALEVGSQVFIEDMDDDAALLAEVDENLCRHELNALDRAIFLAERKRLYLKINPEAGRGKAKKIKDSGKGSSCAFFSRSFARATSERVGLSRATIDRSLGIADKLDRETMDALRGTSVETNQKELLALAAITDLDERHLIVGAIREGKAKSTLKAKYAVGLEREPNRDPQLAHLIAAKYHISKLDAQTMRMLLSEFGWSSAKAPIVDAPAAKPAPKGGAK
jgi:ParB family chromosome partitioning protein